MDHKGNVILVDNDALILTSYSRHIKANGYHIDTYETVKEATDALSTNKYDVGLIDMNFPEDKEGGLKIVKFIKQNNINTKAIILTGKGSFANFRKVFKDVFDYIEKDDDVIHGILQRLSNAIKINKLENDNERLKKELERANENKSPIYQSTHTFEKCYNIPTRNFCYRIRKKVPLRFKEAHDLTNMIDDSIDLWANQFSMELYDPRTKNIEGSQSIKWIDSFPWKPFQKDLEKFIEQYFIMNINDLFDHYTNQFFKKDNKVIILSDIYDKKYSWADFISFKFNEDEQMIMGVRPFFRATLINMISNAVEAMDFYDIVQGNSEKASIEIMCKQDSEKTTIELQSQGKIMSKKRVKFYNERIFHLAKEGKLKLSDTCLEKDIHDKKFTTKPGIGSGYALIHAAHYFSRIEREYNDSDKTERGLMHVETNGNKTTFHIELPFGKTMTDLFKNKKNYYSNNNNTRFRWHKSLDSKNSYEKIQDEPDDHLSNEPILKENLDQIPDDNNREVLIIEDSRPDRFRMRMLIEHLFIRHKRFAWDAKEKAVLSVDNIEALMKITEPNILVLDLAWTPYDENNLHGMLFQTEEQIRSTIDEKKEIRIPHSFDLLERIKTSYESYSYLDQIIIMSQFVPPVSDGLISYIENNYKKKFEDKKCNINLDILHKWRQESDFRKILINNQRRK
jgi:ActR/RegA family two-component response regulator